MSIARFGLKAMAVEWTITIEGRNKFGAICRKEVRTNEAHATCASAPSGLASGSPSRSYPGPAGPEGCGWTNHADFGSAVRNRGKCRTRFSELIRFSREPGHASRFCAVLWQKPVRAIPAQFLLCIEDARILIIAVELESVAGGMGDRLRARQRIDRSDDRRLDTARGARFPSAGRNWL